MPFIKSISGFRGTIGGEPGKNLTPVDLVECAASFAQWIKSSNHPNKVVIGRDGRSSGLSVKNIVVHTLVMMGIDVVDLDFSTTPTIEIAVPLEAAGGGIVLTASHNPANWNALKLLNHAGEFIAGEEAEHILRMAEEKNFRFAHAHEFGKIQIKTGYIDTHVGLIHQLKYLNLEKIRIRKFRVVVDCINSTGALAIPPLLEALGVSYTLINEEVNGLFAHNPEPLPENITDLIRAVKAEGADLGIAVDPDVDRLALICEDGSPFGEEYTLVAAADYLLEQKNGNTVSNLSSSRALRDITEHHGANYYASPVGEMHVVRKMKEVGAIIGGEGNGGVILPDLHYGRDALVGIALILSSLAEKNIGLSDLKGRFPKYYMAKSKIDVRDGGNLDEMLDVIALEYGESVLNREDGLKIDLPDSWIHLRKSNTEPIIRIYTESNNEHKSQELCRAIIDKFG